MGRGGHRGRPKATRPICFLTQIKCSEFLNLIQLSLWSRNDDDYQAHLQLQCLGNHGPDCLRVSKKKKEMET